MSNEAENRIVVSDHVDDRPTYGDLVKKIEKLNSYISKVDARITKSERQLEKARGLNKKEAELVEKGLELMELKKDSKEV